MKAPAEASFPADLAEVTRHTGSSAPSRFRPLELGESLLEVGQVARFDDELGFLQSCGCPVGLTGAS